MHVLFSNWDDTCPVPDPEHAVKAVEDYRTPRRFATVEASGDSARAWSAVVLYRFPPDRSEARVFTDSHFSP